MRATSHGITGCVSSTQRTCSGSSWSQIVWGSSATPMFAATIATMKSQCELSETTCGVNPQRRQASRMWPWSANSGR
jgi:hypothetical protein